MPKIRKTGKGKKGKKGSIPYPKSKKKKKVTASTPLVSSGRVMVPVNANTNIVRNDREVLVPRVIKSSPVTSMNRNVI